MGKAETVQAELGEVLDDLKAVAERLGVGYTFLGQFDLDGEEISAVATYVPDGATSLMRSIGAACVRDGGNVEGRIQVKPTKEFEVD